MEYEWNVLMEILIAIVYVKELLSHVEGIKTWKQGRRINKQINKVTFTSVHARRGISFMWFMSFFLRLRWHCFRSKLYIAVKLKPRILKLVHILWFLVNNHKETHVNCIVEIQKTWYHLFLENTLDKYIRLFLPLLLRKIKDQNLKPERSLNMTWRVGRYVGNKCLVPRTPVPNQNWFRLYTTQCVIENSYK